MDLAVIGTGTVGLVIGAGFAELGHAVTCTDIDPDADRIARLSRGEVPVHEPGLGDLIARNVERGRLRFALDAGDAVAGARIVFIAVGTPSGRDGRADVSAVVAAARAIARSLTGFAVVVTKSTVPVGTADELHRIIAAEAAHPFAVASNPEFLREGTAVDDFLRPARVVLGADDPRALEELRRLYAGLADRIQVMRPRSAELSKYAANAMLATRISFMNELALFAETAGADIEDVRIAIGADPRIGPAGLYAGVGFGGGCLGKDLRALVRAADDAGRALSVVAAAAAANERQKRVLAARIVDHFGGSLRDRRIAIWGLAFKPDTDDIREAPALVLVAELAEAGAELRGYDPAAMPGVARGRHPIALVDDPYAAAAGCDALVLVTEWDELRAPDHARLRAVMRGRVLFDGRNAWDAAAARAAGFHHVGIGRPA